MGFSKTVETSAKSIPCFCRLTAFFASSQVNCIAANVYTIRIYVKWGAAADASIWPDSLGINRLCVPLILLGCWLGLKLLRRIPEKLFARLVQILAAIAAV